MRIPAGVFALGRTDEGYDPPRVNFSIDPQFYIARTLTTVAQYARFIAGKGYESGVNIWGKQGLEWRSGAFDAKPSSKPTEGRDKARKPVSHSMPGEWDAQRHHASRPVTGITWFEARAYARWLDAEMRADLLGAGLADYAVSLPTEPQWERAARAQSSTEAHDGRWPWGDEAKTAPQRANIDASGIGHVSSVGVFAPNAIGLYDIAGNAWQWMDNRSQPSERETFAPVKRDATLDNVLLSLCGGSWFDSPVYASCSSRSGYRPVDCFNYVGVRVVLSLAKNEA